MDWSKLLGFDQLSRPACGSQRAQRQDVSLLTKVGVKRQPTS
jgi:hypothetical protein